MLLNARPAFLKTAVAFMLAAALVLWLLLVGGCAAVGRIRSGGAEVRGVPSAGTPATLATASAGSQVALPAGSKVTVTEEAAVSIPARGPAEPAYVRPARKVTEILPSGPTEYRTTDQRVEAATGTIDTTVAKHALDVAERRWLLWTAIACGIAGVLARSLVPAWPAISNGLILAAALAFAAWKFAEIPAWLWVCALVVAALLVAAYKRAEWDRDGDGIPDALQRKP